MNKKKMQGKRGKKNHFIRLNVVCSKYFHHANFKSVFKKMTSGFAVKITNKNFIKPNI